MSEQMTYDQQAQRIATLERELAHMTERETQHAVRVAELEAQYEQLLKWAHDVYTAYRDAYGWIESESDHLVVGRPLSILRIDENNGCVRQQPG